MTTADIEEELVADGIAAIFTTDEGVEQFAEYVAKKSEPEKKSIVQAFKELVAHIVDTIKKALSRGNLTQYQKEYLEMEKEQAEHIRTLFLDSLDKASENYKSEQKNNTVNNGDENEINIKQTIKLSKKITTPLEDFAQKVLDMGEKEAKQLKAADTYVSIMKETPSIILENVNGAENLEVIMRFDSFYLETRKDGVLEGNYHDLGLNISKIPEYISNPDAIIKLQNGRINLISSIISSKNRIVSIELNAVKDINSKFDKYNLVVSVFNSGNNYINNLAKKAISLEYEKEDLAQVNHQLHESLAIINDKSSNKSISNSNENVKNSFTVDEPVEQVRDLVAVHNINEEKLMKSLRLGGLPMPSIAVMKAKEAKGNDVYGDISLVFPKSTIDPSLNTDNKIYGGDAWTPVYPTVEYKINEDKANEIYSRARKATKDAYAYKLNSVSFHPSNIEDALNRKKGENSLIDSYKNDYGMKQFYLAETGEPVKDVKVKETRTELSDEQVKMYDYLLEHFGDTLSILDNGPYPAIKWINEYGADFDNVRRDYYRQLMPDITEEQLDNIFNNLNEASIDKVRLARQINRYRRNGRVTIETENDNEATEKEIDSKINQKEYEAWLNDLFSGIAEKKGIRNNIDPYTSSGNLRSFEQLHYEETLENVVKQMRTQKNGDVSLFAGLGIWGVAAKNYGTLEQVKSDSFRLQNLSENEFKKIKQGFGERLDEIAESLENKYKADNPLIDSENKMTNIIDALRESKTKSGVLKYLKQYFKNASESTVDDLLDLVADIGNMPVDYFEAKPQRAVGFDEITVAVIPNTSSEELKNSLADNNINYIEYDKSSENSRLNTLNDYLENSGNDVRFSKDVDEFNEQDYNYPKLGNREYKHLRSEIITNFPNVRNEVNCIRLASTDSTYIYILDDDYKLTVLGKNKSINIHERYKNDDGTRNRITQHSQVFRSNRGYGGSSIFSTKNSGTAGRNVGFFGTDLQQERKSDQRGNAETGDNADLREEKSSKTVNDNIAELKRENKKLKEANELLRHEFELTGGLETSSSSAENIGIYLNKTYNTSISGAEIGRDIKAMCDRVMQDEYRSYDTLYNEAI
ncbi:MAG: hypothetical protein ACI4XC_06095 [Eubacterium sp.]